MLKEFQNLKELFSYIDSEIAQNRKALGELIRAVEDLRGKAEKYKKILEVVSKLAPGSQQGQEGSYSFDLRGVKIMINPLPFQELSEMEKLLEKLNTRLTKLANIRKDLEAIAGMEISGRIVVIFEGEVPETIILKI